MPVTIIFKRRGWETCRADQSVASGNPVGQIHDGGRECDGYGTLQFRLERVSPHTAMGKILEPFHALRRHLSGQLHYIRREVN